MENALPTGPCEFEPSCEYSQEPMKQRTVQQLPKPSLTSAVYLIGKLVISAAKFGMEFVVEGGRLIMKRGK